MDQQRLRELLSSTVYLLPLATSLLGLLGGWLAGWLQGRRSARRKALAASDDSRLSEVRDLRKGVSQLQNDNTRLSNFLLTLPDLARQLNTNQEKRKIPALLIGFIEQLFEAEQILVFLTDPGGRHLTLSAARGLPESSFARHPIHFGRGRIGWVAHHQITMDENDFMQKSRVAKKDLVADRNPAFRVDLCSPMVSQGRTLGVISLGGVGARPKNEKNMLRMVADLGSIAIQNITMFSMIQSSANRDGLTGLSNKSHFLERLADEMIKADKEHTSLSLFLFDIDHFKAYNDTNGHVAGDEALRITGRLLGGSIRQDDLAARYGGEEFVVLLPNTDKQGAGIVAEKIRAMVQAHDYPNESSQPGGHVTISGGVATYPEDARTAADLIRCADQALYRGKRAGRNQVFVHETRYLSDETGSGLETAARQTQET